MKPKRRRGRVINPLLLVAGVQKLGEGSAMPFLSRFDSFLFALERGHAHGSEIRGLTLFLAALYDASRHYQARKLEALIDQTGELWIRASQRCADKGITTRIVVNAEELAQLKLLYAAMRVFLPEVQVGPWKSFLENAAERWDSFVASSSFKSFAERA